VKGLQQDDEFGIVAEINMVPLIDVALVLLIIFMVMTPILIQSQIKVNLPEAGASESSREGEEIRVLVTADGVTFIDDVAVEADDLAAVIGRKVVQPAEDTLVVEADRTADFGIVVRAMDAAKSVGIQKIGVAVKEKSGRAAAPGR
jgi:biopolymer transport protein TolR